MPAARKLLNELFKLSIRAAQWTDYKCDAKYSEDQSERRLFVLMRSARSFGTVRPRRAWVRAQPLHWCWKIPVIYAQMGRRIRSKRILFVVQYIVPSIGYYVPSIVGLG